MMRISVLAGLAGLSAGGQAAEPSEKFERLFDGRTLDGWYVVGAGSFVVEDGVIRCTHEAEQPDHGLLVNDVKVRDFTLRLKFKAVQGNSGVYFRSELRPDHVVKAAGLQAEIDASRDIGGLYDTLGRGWVVRPAPEQVRSWFRTNEWNTMTINARGGHVVVQVNGARTAEVTDDPGRREGHLALQVHGGQEGEVLFKDIELSRPLP